MHVNIIFYVVTAILAVTVSAAPIQNTNEISQIKGHAEKGFVFDPKLAQRKAARRMAYKKQKRNQIKDCCGQGGAKLNFGLGASLELGSDAPSPAPAVAPAPAPVAALQAPPVPAAPYNRNDDRNGDSVVVVVDAKHG